MTSVFEQKLEYLLEREKIFKKGKCHSCSLRKTFQIDINYFLLHRIFQRDGSLGIPLRQSFPVECIIWCNSPLSKRSPPTPLTTSSFPAPLDKWPCPMLKKGFLYSFKTVG